VRSVALGTATLTGAGSIASAVNVFSQNAGVWSVETDAEGKIPAGGVTFAPAANGGRPLSSAELAALEALNVGGVPLGPTSLEPFGLSLTLAASPLAATQTITVSAATAVADDLFTPFGPFSQVTTSGTLTANGANDPSTSPIPGVALRCGELAAGNQASLTEEMDTAAVFLFPPFISVPPAPGGRTLSFTLDLDAVQPGVQRLQANFITTNQIIIDPNNVGNKVYDALGPLGNNYLSLTLNVPYVYTNDLAPVPEEEGDCEEPALDLVDWRIQVLTS